MTRSNRDSTTFSGVVKDVLKPMASQLLASFQQQQQQRQQLNGNSSNNATTTSFIFGGHDDVAIQWSDIFNKKVLFFVFVTGPIWILGHLLDRGFSKLFVERFIPPNFDVHVTLHVLSQISPTCTHILIYICNATSFKNLFDLETTMTRLRVPDHFQPLFRHIQPKNQAEYDSAEGIMNELVQDLASSGISPHTTSIYDLSSPTRPHFNKSGIRTSSTTCNNNHSNNNSNSHNNNKPNDSTRFKVFSRLFGGHNTVQEMSPIRSAFEMQPLES